MRSKKRSKTWLWTNTPIARQIFSTCRMLHIYISTALFSLLVFFCITGVTLNHLSWIEQSDSVLLQLPLSTSEKRLKGSTNIDTTQLQALLEQELGLNSIKELNIDYELAEVTVDFSLPAGYAYATWYVTDGIVEVEYEQGNIFALMNDLHKGRHTGPQWRWVIDIAAVLILLFSLTGLAILFQQLKRRRMGLWLVLCGTLTPILFYLIWVPRIH